MSRRAIIIGAGPAGLTAAYELLQQTDIAPIVLEADHQVGGLSKTVVYNGNRMDIGGHRFFSKSDRVMAWWLDMAPIQKLDNPELTLQYHQRAHQVAFTTEGADPERDELVMLVGTRRSRIYFNGRFFEYPVSLSVDTLRNLGFMRTLRIGLSYLRRTLFPIRPVRHLEDFMINRFGDELYRTFFKAYTEKVWGIPCEQISAAWGAQRIKDVSVGKAVMHWLRKKTGIMKGDIAQKDVSTSMIEQYLYPKLGPGQIWEEAARRIQAKGGQILLGRKVIALRVEGARITGVTAMNTADRREEFYDGDLFFSSMPVKELIAAMGDAPPVSVRKAAEELPYRDFITVGLLVERLKIGENGRTTDSWLYIQEPDVHLGRVQFYNNWSRHLIRYPNLQWLGLEYFCNRGDALWDLSDAAFKELAEEELTRIGIIDPGVVVDAVVQRVEKAYPAYYGGFARFPEIRRYLDAFDNLYCIGRNGMHKYNNQDHAMMTGMLTAMNIVTGNAVYDVWEVNEDAEYGEAGVSG
ncbi:MAG TPA: NAD(P)/FAD-dependent oxidoreductase, partial [Candidatus Hydrogenedentes bacterium]|nr:NAD(P)/FAD-dependent oxidoreductase [Candidatus Hydrogenedentota bacterium]